MMRSLLALTLIALASSLPACSLLGDDDAPVDGHVRITADGSAITIRNGTDERIYYTAFARGVLPTINWAQHVTEDRGPSLAPGQRAHLAAADIWRFSEAGPEVVVYWWRVEEQGDERVPAEPEAVLVEL
jgi:hypothetical protein